MYRRLNLLLALFSICSHAFSQITFQKAVRRVSPSCGNEDIRSFARSHDNGYVLAGTLLLGFNQDFFSWAKADSAGNLIWLNNAGSSWQSRLNSIALSSDSGFLLCGQAYNGNDRYPLVIKTDSNGVVSWHQTMQGGWEITALSTIECYDGGNIFTGVSQGNGIYYDDIVLAKLSSGGSLLWSKFISGIETDETGYSVIQDSDSGFVICGITYGFGQSAALLLKVDSTGNVMWAKNYSGANIMGGTYVRKTFDGGFIFSGYDVYNWPYNHPFIIKTDSLGDTLWTREFNTSDLMTIKSVEQTRDSGYILTGAFGPQYGTKAILIKLEPEGNMAWSSAFITNFIPQAGIGAFETTDGGFIIGCDRCFYLIKTDSVGSSCNSYAPIIQMIPGNQISVTSSVTVDSSNVLAVFSESFGSAMCDTVVIDDCLSVSNQELKNVELNISLYPNPSNDFINIECEKDIISMEIFNSMGQRHFSKKIDSKTFILDIDFLSPGVYLIKCLTPSGLSSQLFLKK